MRKSCYLKEFLLKPYVVRCYTPLQVVSDYVPKASAPAVRAGLLGVTLLTIAGLTKLSMQGEGVTRTAKRLWKKGE